MTINDLINRAHSTAKAKGWWDEPRSVLECLALIHSEVSEAVEEYRKPTLTNFIDGTHATFTVELADVLIRIADLCGRYELDLEAALEAKLKYNLTRPYRHGGKRA
jgi:NTP pyrophosphatase (non-canonical NTP hydrolase)